MTIINSTPLRGGTAGFSNQHLGGALVQKFQYDISAFTGATGDQVYLMALPAFTQINWIQAIVVTAVSVGSGPGISLGDTGSATRYVNAASTLTAGTVLTQAVTTNPLKFYSAADQLLLKIAGGTLPGTGLIRFVICLSDCTADAPMTTQG